MTDYRVIATDDVQSELAGHDGASYHSLPPTPRARARARARTDRTRAAPRRTGTVASGAARRHADRPNRARAMTTTTPRPAAIDAQALDGYLRTLAGPAPGARLLEIRFALRYRDMGRVFIAAHSAPGASRLIRRLAARTDVYVGVCLRTRRAGGRDAIDRSHLAFVEIDTTDALDRLRAFQHPPTMIVSSGSAGHAHAYFTLSAPVAVPELERANGRLAHALGGDLASVDAARILRPPSSWNHKHSPPTPVELIELDPIRRYELDKLVDGLDDPPGRPSVRMTTPRRVGRTEIDRLLLAIPATEYVRALTGITPDRAGKIHCPFHEDQTPSLQLYEDGTWYCYGACKAGGSIFDFASRLWLTGQSGAGKLRGREFLRVRQRLAQVFLGERGQQ
jgi:CHC2 zinc finger